MTSQTLLEATWRVETMVGRRQELNRIKEAIYTHDKDCRVVVITGEGGVGKSRLLEEVLWRAGHPDVRREAQEREFIAHEQREDWRELGQVTVSNIIDLQDMRLTARGHLLRALRNALARVDGVDFQRFEGAERAYLDQLRASAEFAKIAAYFEAAENAFWTDYKAHAQNNRIVLIIDTAERLALDSSKWAIENQILKPEEALIASQQWLLAQLQKGRFVNTTLVIAGRPKEGAPFFQALQETLRRMGLSPIEVPLRPLTLDETGQYFQYLAHEWAARSNVTGNRGNVNGEYIRIGRFMRDLAGDQEQIEVLHLATEGRPVLLSLYSDLIYESDEIPELLRLTKQEMQNRLDPQVQGAKGVQTEIERALIETLFHRPGLRSDILRALARCPAGLDAQQIHFLLHSSEEQTAREWNPNPLRVQEIEDHLVRIRRLSIARPRPNGRLALQDEIYRIYAQRMNEQEKYREYEIEVRKKQYAKLAAWAEVRLTEARARLRSFLIEDEKRIAAAISSPKQALRPYIVPPGEPEQEERADTQDQLWDWELEKLHYELLCDPAAGLNDDYTDLSERSWRDNNEEADFSAQQEMWRVLHDNYALQFTSYTDKQIQRFRDAAKEEDIARWIKRFILRRDYIRAIEFFDAAEQAIEREPEDQRRSWQRPINRIERRIWRNYAQIMLGKDVFAAVQDIEKAVQILEHEPAERLGEKARIRQLRIIGAGYNFAGYGYAAPLGQFRQAVEAYGKALWYVRQTHSTALQAAIRNNLGRALASLGREERGYRVCADALALRRELGAAIPVAFSLNTLALINNAMQRIPSAWRQAAHAAAIFRRAGDSRGLGLALIQLGIGLRRLANSRETVDASEVTPAELYQLAHMALGEAVDIFRESPEVLRWVEATLETGCVLRDQMRLIDPRQATDRDRQRMNRLYRDAQIELQRAIHKADERGFRYLALQAHVDLAWAHFYAERYDEAEHEAKKAQDERVPHEYLIHQGKLPQASATEAHYFYQLAKLSGLRAAIAMKYFERRREDLRSEHQGRRLYEMLKQDLYARELIADAAEQYVLSLRYGQLFSPRSRSLAITYDQIYEHVKRFNPTEYRMFYEAQERVAQKYTALKGEPASSIRPFDFSDLQIWLDDCFGPLMDEGDTTPNGQQA